MTSWRFVLIPALLFSFSTVAAAQIERRTLLPGPLNCAFDAQVEDFGASPVREFRHVVYDRGKQRLEEWSIRYPESSGPGTLSRPTSPPAKQRQQVFYGYPVVYPDGHSLTDSTSSPVSLYDGTKPFIRWGYDPKTKMAMPSVTSCGHALSTLAKKQGQNAIIRRYQLPAEFKFDAATFSTLPHQFQSAHTTELLPRNKKGKGKVAGYVCDVYQTEGPAPRSSGLIVQTVWVEPKSGLILKRENRAKPAAGARTASYAPYGYVVRRIRFFPRLPASRFQLPPGTTVRLPALFKDVPLPPGVKRARMTGPRALSGFDFAAVQRQHEAMFHRRGVSAPVRK